MVFVSMASPRKTGQSSRAARARGGSPSSVEVGVDLGEGDRGVHDALGDPAFVHDGEWFAPVPLAAEDCVADAVIDLSGAASLGFDPIEGA